MPNVFDEKRVNGLSFSHSKRGNVPIKKQSNMWWGELKKKAGQELKACRCIHPSFGVLPHQRHTVPDEALGLHQLGRAPACPRGGFGGGD